MGTIQRTPGGFPRGRPALSVFSGPRYGWAVGEPTICSAKGCQAAASWQLRWNNPRLHHPDRRKVWLACDGHRARLGDFLDARGFLREVAPLRPPATPDWQAGSSLEA